MTIAYSRPFVLIVFTIVLVCFDYAYTQNPVIPLYERAAPGSENWTQKEVEYAAEWDGSRMVRNVTHPTLTMYLPDPAKADGTAIIICPGGAYWFLSWENEGTKVAEWLAERGAAAFVLKYRLRDSGATEEEFEKVMEEIRQLMKRISTPGERPRDDAGSAEREERQRVIELAIEDGRQAIRIVRRNAREWNVDPERIGIMGFSAGAGVTLGAALKYDEESRPNFAAPIYGGFADGAVIPKDAPPLFILAAQDDNFAAIASARMFYEWKNAGHSAELHIYSKGGHGFGMSKRGLPVDTWIERFYEWMETDNQTDR